MKKIVSSLLLILAFTGLGAQQRQDPAAVAALKENIHRAGNNTHVYEFGPLSDTPAPEGYKPFYISHYGRHGARTDWGGKDYAAVISTLEAARDEGLLTPAGDSLLAEVRLVAEAHGGMDGRLTQRGIREHALLAERMYGRYPEVFRDGNRQVRSISSTAPRCLLSMIGFTTRLNELQPDLDFYWDTGERFMEYLTNGAPPQVGRGARKILSEYGAYVPDTVFVMERLFTDPVRARAHVPGSIVSFERKIFEAARVSDGCDIPGNLFRHLPFDAVYYFWETGNLDSYLNHGNSAEFGEARMETTHKVVADIVEKAEEVIANGGWAADLRFGHDYPILSLASYLGLEGVGDRWPASEVSAHWWTFRHVPFAANLQMVFYRNDGGDVLVKCLYNEQECLLRGLAPVAGPYYRWEDVRTNIKGYLR